MSPRPQIHRRLRSIVSILFPEAPVAIWRSPTLPPEIIELIMDMADKTCLLNMALVSRRFMQRTRTRLFRNLIFDIDKDPARYDRRKRYTIGRKFDQFLDLMECPTNTIVKSVRIIHINGLFDCENHKYKPRRNASLLASRLSRVLSLRLSSIDVWDNIPPHIVDFLLSLPVIEVQIERTLFRRTTAFIQLLESPLMAHALLSLYDVQLSQTPYLAANAYPLTPHFHFLNIDEISLVNFRGAWRSSNMWPQVTIDTLYLGLKNQFPRLADGSDVYPLLYKISQHIGPSLASLCVSLGTRHQNHAHLMVQDLQKLRDRIDFSSFAALKALHVGVIEMNDRPMLALDAALYIARLLPRHRIETVGLILDTSCVDLSRLPRILRAFPWAQTICGLQSVIPSLKLIRFTVGDRDPEAKALGIYLKLVKKDLRRALKCSGVEVEVVFQTHTWTTLLPQLTLCVNP
ncbi:hypothetical protein H0H92_015484 [Tricholoma furcatifolium]|nr:hypothetical protein H0H92_015484 [Tricholoma furcatifolium]